MEEFTLDAFYNALVSFIAIRFPYMEDEEVDRSKHPKRNPLHLKDAIFDRLQPIHTLDTVTFEIGNEQLEMTHPYYHILEDSETIHKANKGTKRSKGSQDRVNDAKARDYGIVRWNGKTYSQEYKKNVRGARSKAQSATRRAFFVDSYGQVFRTQINKGAEYYLNIHYHYIERAIDFAIPDLCLMFNMKSRRKQDTGLEEEWLAQESVASGTDLASGLIDALNSFGEDY